MHMKNIFAVLLAAILSTIFTTSASAEATGNRYNLPRDYKSEISAAKAYLITSGKNDREKHEHRSKHGDEHVIIIDVRTIEEHVAGHPKNSYNIPYPHIQGRPNRTDPVYIAQNPRDFFEAVAAKFPDRDTPILTLCRTGYRSVLAANILSNPSKNVPEYEGLDIEGYTNVRNIWEGFIGNPKTFTDDKGNNSTLDLNNDGEITDADKDGWANYQGLPVSTRLKIKYLYEPYLDLYFQ